MVTTMTNEALKVPQGMKPQEVKSEGPFLADVDTETPYFQCIDSAQVYLDSHDWPLAERWLVKAVQTDPENPSNSMVLSNIATLQRYQGKLAEAVKNYSLALDLTPHAVTLLLNRAALLVQMDSVQRAIADFERVRDLDPYLLAGRAGDGAWRHQAGRGPV